MDALRIRIVRSVILYCSLGIFIGLRYPVGYANEQLEDVSAIGIQPISGPYCGIYSSCRALQLLGKEVITSDFATKDFVTHPLGSTPADLIRLCNSSGLYAVGFKKLSKLEVVTLGLPIIANVRKNAVSSDFDHWVCILAANGDLFLFDNNEAGRKITFGELAAIWNGYGIVVSKGSIAFQVISVRIAFVGIACWLCWYLSRKLRVKSKGVLGVFNWPIAVLSLAIAIVFFFGDVNHHVYATRSSVEPFAMQLFDEASLDELRYPPAESLVIDARLKKDFEKGSIHGALNVPVSSTTFSIVDSLQGYPHDKPILVYCQSRLCPYDETIARRLRVLGFSKVRVSKMGWRELMDSHTEGVNR